MMGYRDEDDLMSDYCPKCAQYTGGDSFCPNCGTKIFDDSGLESDEEGSAIEDEEESDRRKRNQDDDEDDEGGRPPRDDEDDY